GPLRRPALHAGPRGRLSPRGQRPRGALLSELRRHPRHRGRRQLPRRHRAPRRLRGRPRAARARRGRRPDGPRRLGRGPRRRAARPRPRLHPVPQPRRPRRLGLHPPALRAKPMQIDIDYRPGQSMARVQLEAGESIVAEGGAMVGMSPHLSLETRSAGLMKGLKRMLGGESFHRNTFHAKDRPGELLLAQPLCGDLGLLDLSEGPYLIQSQSYVASTPDAQIETKVGGLRSLFAGEGFFLLEATGSGQVLVGAFGGIQELRCEGSLIVDTGHLVAWDASLRYQAERATHSLLGSFFSGEGLVCRLEGQGRVLIQTRNPMEFG